MLVSNISQCLKIGASNGASGTPRCTDGLPSCSYSLSRSIEDRTVPVISCKLVGVEANAQVFKTSEAFLIDLMFKTGPGRSAIQIVIFQMLHSQRYLNSSVVLFNTTMRPKKGNEGKSE